LKKKKNEKKRERKVWEGRDQKNPANHGGKKNGERFYKRIGRKQEQMVEELRSWY